MEKANWKFLEAILNTEGPSKTLPSGRLLIWFYVAWHEDTPKAFNNKAEGRAQRAPSGKVYDPREPCKGSTRLTPACE
ncbi:hypothetical protein EDS67_25785 [candidate division KSB1 bacterium]|nr:MAG: hypothetical protein EDS67_25785 [candidate division KSB1 bacterium]MBC6948343.1 hypothetical protein [candidate division KSB1 bacterium]MCE7945018.1 hypothetical protein [Chlorobi bacterium CHB1]